MKALQEMIESNKAQTTMLMLVIYQNLKIALPMFERQLKKHDPFIPVSDFKLVEEPKLPRKNSLFGFLSRSKKPEGPNGNGEAKGSMIKTLQTDSCKQEMTMSQPIQTHSSGSPTVGLNNQMSTVKVETHSSSNEKSLISTYQLHIVQAALPLNLKHVVLPDFTQEVTSTENCLESDCTFQDKINFFESMCQDGKKRLSDMKRLTQELVKMEDEPDVVEQKAERPMQKATSVPTQGLQGSSPFFATKPRSYTAPIQTPGVKKNDFSSEGKSTFHSTNSLYKR